MAGIDVKRFLNNFTQNYKGQTFQAKGTFNSPAPSQPLPSTTPQQTAQNTGLAQNLTQNVQIAQNIQLNNLQNMDRAIYAKEVMGIPKNVNEFIYMIQRGMTQSQFNEMFANQMAAQRNNLSQLQAQILAQLQGLSTSTAKEMINIQLSSQVQSSLRTLEILSGGMIDLNQISMLLQKTAKKGLQSL